MSDLVLIDSRNPSVLSLTLNRPEKRNALSTELIRQLKSAIDSANVDRRCRVLIVRGNGPAFCAGLDLQEASDPARADQSAHLLAELYTSLCMSPLVTIAAAHGSTFGGGAGLIAACDLAVASEDLRIGFPEVRRGLVAALVMCMVRRQVGERAMRELVLLGRTIPAIEAQALGLLNHVVPPAQFEDEVEAVAKQACEGAPGAVARTKRLLDEMSGRPIAEDLRLALGAHLQARRSAEAAEGIAAFLEHREPRWEDRPEAF